MGPRLTALAALTLTGALSLHAPPAGAQKPEGEEAAALFDEGLEAYREKDYERAIDRLERSYELEPSIDTLYAWAQAERLSGDCDRAVRLYRQILDESPNFKHATIIRENLELCAEEEEPAPAPEPDASPEPEESAAPPAPPPRDQGAGGGGGVDALAVSLFAGGALSLGAATGLYIASNASRDGAARARTYDEYLDLRDRADLQRGLSIGAAATGAALIGLGVFRWVTASDSERSRSAEVTAGAGPGSAVVRFTTRW